MAKGDTYTVWLKGVDIALHTTVSTNGRVLEGTFDSDGGVKWFVIQEKIGRTGKVTKVTRYAATEIAGIETNFETE